jgi:hypothetical protein
MNSIVGRRKKIKTNEPPENIKGGGCVFHFKLRQRSRCFVTQAGAGIVSRYTVCIGDDIKYALLNE